MGGRCGGAGVEEGGGGGRAGGRVGRWAGAPTSLRPLNQPHMARHNGIKGLHTGPLTVRGPKRPHFGNIRGAVMVTEVLYNLLHVFVRQGLVVGVALLRLPIGSAVVASRGRGCSRQRGLRGWRDRRLPERREAIVFIFNVIAQVGGHTLEGARAGGGDLVQRVLNLGRRRGGQCRHHTSCKRRAAGRAIPAPRL